MSGIFGLFQLDNSPVNPADMQKMMAAMGHWGPDGRSQLIAGPIGLGQLMLHNTPQAHHEQLPRQTGSGLLLTAEARLDNRRDLFRQLNIPPPEQELTTDSQLIELAYEKWGEACPDHLIGDWSFAIWNPQIRRLFLARDHTGNTGLYYFQDAHRFMFASSRDALLALGVPRRLNELYLARVLISWPAYRCNRTIDLDIFRLPPACTLTITPEKTAVQQYWRLEDTPELHLPSFEAYAAGFMDAYTEAVACRLRSSTPVGVTLSGGLDSGSVAALAARALLPQDKRLAAFTAVPHHSLQNTVGPNRFGDETKFSRATANFHPNIEHHLLNSSQISPIEGIRRILALRNEPDHAGANYFWIADLLQTAQTQGIGTLLTGQGGNATVSWSGAPYLTSLRKLWQKEGWKTAVKQKLPFAVLRALRQQRTKKTTWPNAAIQADFARRLNIPALQAASIGHDLSLAESIKTPRELRCAIIQPNNSLPGAVWAEIGAGFGLEVRDPTLDKRLLTYTLSIPDSVFQGPGGQDRWLMREAMSGLLPDAVRLNTWRGSQAADLGYRLLACGPEVEQLLSEIPQTEAAKYIDPAKLKDVWAQLQADVSQLTTHRAITILMRGLNAAMFFSKLA